MPSSIDQIKSLVSKLWLFISTTILSTTYGCSRSFSSEMGILTSVVLLPNGVFILCYPDTNFSSTWLFILFSLLLLLIFLLDPPIIAIVFELATMTLLPIELSRYKDQEAAGWMPVSISLAKMNASIMLQMYLVYYTGRWLVMRKRSTQTAADAAAAAPRFLTGMNVFLEMLILFASNTSTMSSVSSLRFQESTVRVQSGLIMVLLGMMYLISSKVGTLVMMQARLDQAAAQLDNGAVADHERRTVLELLELEQPADQEEPEEDVAAVADDDDQIVQLDL